MNNLAMNQSLFEWQNENILYAAAGIGPLYLFNCSILKQFFAFASLDCSCFEFYCSPPEPYEE